MTRPATGLGTSGSPATSPGRRQTMPDEFVVFDDGEESDWIDPVFSVDETGTAWFVDNGPHVYEVPKLPGRTVETRQMGTGHE